MAVIKREINKLTGLTCYPAVLHAFLSKFLVLYVQRVKVGVISDVWADQLLLDTQTLRGYLETLPGIKRDAAAGQAGRRGRKKANVEEKEKEKEKGATSRRGSGWKRGGKRRRRTAQQPQTDFSATAPSMMHKELSKDDLKQASDRQWRQRPQSLTTPATAPTSAAASPTHSLTTSLSSSPIIAPAVPPSSTLPHVRLLQCAEPQRWLHTAATPATAAGEPAATSTGPQPTDPYLLLISHHLLPLERMLRVMSSPSPQLIATFRKVWPKGVSSLLQLR